MIQLYDYQASDQSKALEALKKHQRVLFQASTGYGKTIVMTDLVAKLINNYNYNILILVHRSELLEQTRNALIKFGISSEPITDKTKFLLRNTNVYVAMVETIHNRLSKDSNFLTDIDLIITDEAHIQVFHKVTDFFPNAKELAFTATPLINKRERFNLCTFCNAESETKICTNCNNETHEYSRPVTMSQFYDTIIVGYPIHKLIERGTLVPELPMAFSASGLENLKVGSDGDYTTKSLNEVYEQEGNLLSVMENYKTYCTGKKTIIFNSSTKINLIIYEQFKAEGINVRMFDSVNSKESGDRDELLKWYENTPDAVLLNVGTFTTGFDEPTIEACILNTDTLSYSLYMQMVGRAGRSTDKIFKPNFILIDCGTNIERFGLWSDPTTDWEKIFYNGLGEEKPVRKIPQGFETCENCWNVFERKYRKCPHCEEEIPEPKVTEKTAIEALALPIREIPPPSPQGILKYVQSKNEKIGFGHKILISQIIDMFIFYRVDYELYKSTKANGKLLKKIKELLHPTYFVLLNAGLEGGNRTLKNLQDRVLNRLEKHYEKTK